MRKPVIIRLLGLAALYFTVFFILAVIQFSKQENFTLQIGTMLVSGSYLPSTTGHDAAGVEAGEKSLAGGVSVCFGGMEFLLEENDDDRGFSLLDTEGKRQPVIPEFISRPETTARFRLSDGTRLVFAPRSSGGTNELRITGEFAPDTDSLIIPFRLQRSALTAKTSDEEPAISYNGMLYQFTRSVELGENGTLILKAGSPAIVYHMIPERKTFNVNDFIIPHAQKLQSFNDAVTQWKDHEFSLWNLNIQSQNSEDAVIAYLYEAVRRGQYRAAIAAIPAGFRSGQRRTWESSVYLGNMDTALRSFVSAEREKAGRISRLVNEKSPALLKESHAFEFLLVRNNLSLFNEGTKYIRSVDPASLSLDLCPGIFEGYADWQSNAGNPFERLVEYACRLVSENLYRDSAEDKVFVFRNNLTDSTMAGGIDVEFNMRLGKALLLWAEKANNSEWAAIGRSIVLSVTGLRDSSGTVPQSLVLSAEGYLEESGGRVDTARLYRIFESGEYYPRAVRIGSTDGAGIWAWTAAATLSSVMKDDILDIRVSFPADETHYMMISGIRPFANVHLYNTNWPTDSQFERYDSSGWVYFPNDQILVLKMKHRTTDEHIRIFYQKPASIESAEQESISEPQN